MALSWFVFASIVIVIIIVIATANCCSPRTICNVIINIGLVMASICPTNTTFVATFQGFIRPNGPECRNCDAAVALGNLGAGGRGGPTCRGRHGVALLYHANASLGTRLCQALSMGRHTTRHFSSLYLCPLVVFARSRTTSCLAVYACHVATSLWRGL